MNLANALCISSVTVGGKSDINKILRVDNLFYFGKSTSTVKHSSINKPSLASTLDSIIVSGEAIQTTTFYYGIGQSIYITAISSFCYFIILS